MKPELDLRVLSIYKNGEVTILINKQKYSYIIDGALLPKFRNLIKRTPGKALNFLKKAAREVVRC